MLPVFLLNLASVVAGRLYPAYNTYKVLQTRNREGLQRCMEYWILFGLYAAAEPVVDFFCFWVPFYYEAKLALLLWLVLPCTRGSTRLYMEHAQPLISQSEDWATTYYQWFSQELRDFFGSTDAPIVDAVSQSLMPTELSKLQQEERQGVDNEPSQNIETATSQPRVTDVNEAREQNEGENAADLSCVNLSSRDDESDWEWTEDTLQDSFVMMDRADLSQEWDAAGQDISSPGVRQRTSSSDVVAGRPPDGTDNTAPAATASLARLSQVRVQNSVKWVPGWNWGKSD